MVIKKPIEKKEKSLDTKAIGSFYKKNPIFSIKSETSKGEVILISFGISKAKAILNHLEELNEFISSVENKTFEECEYLRE